MLMKTIKEEDLNKMPSWEEIGKEVGLKMDATFMMNKRIMEKARVLLEEKGYKSSDFFGEDK